MRNGGETLKKSYKILQTYFVQLKKKFLHKFCKIFGEYFKEILEKDLTNSKKLWGCFKISKNFG